MNKTFCPNSAMHSISCLLPHMYFLYLIVLLLHFPLFLSCFIYFAALPIPSRLFCLFFHSPFLSFSYAWPQLKSVAKIPLTCLQRNPLGTWECHSPSLPLSPLPFSFRTETCHLSLGCKTRKGIVSSTPFYSTLSVSRHVLLMVS